jgi:Flp pilus assembly pilin Flp
MLTKLKRIFKDENGQDMIEYGLLGSFISVVAIGVITLIGQPLIDLFNVILNALG